MDHTPDQASLPRTHPLPQLTCTVRLAGPLLSEYTDFTQRSWSDML